MVKPTEVEPTAAEDRELWNAAIRLSNQFNTVLQHARAAPGGLELEVVIRSLSMHVAMVCAKYDLTIADFEERIAAMPEPIRERILLLATAPTPKGRV